MHPYAQRVLDELQQRVPWEVDFLSAVRELFEVLLVVLQRNPQYEHNQILERLVEPERIVQFRVPWRDAQNRPRVQRGFRVQHSSAIGPYKGGLRFHASVGLDTLKALAFEQTLKNSLTGLPIGGGKGGSDFNPRGRSELEIESFCQSFATALHHHIGADTDVPAGDIGVGAREIGYLFGQHKRLSNRFESSFTGKGLGWGGSQLRPEATGYGVAYFAEEALRARNDSLAGKNVAVSGFGQVAWGAVEKVTQLGARVVTLSGPDGFVHDPAGVAGEKIAYMLSLRATGNDRIEDYAKKFRVEFYAGKRPWGVPVQVALPCAIQNELDVDDAKALVQNKCLAVVEGANIPTTSEAVKVLHTAGVVFVPGKASNSGGVAVSAMEMSQNRGLERWTRERLDQTLREIMSDIHGRTLAAATAYGIPGNYLAGANIAGFERVAGAMLDQGLV